MSAAVQPLPRLPRTPWRVGQLARHTGLTVRALHHYEAVGLLRPSARSQAGHRLYADADIGRLQQIRSLRQLGLSLEQIRGVLADPDVSAVDVITTHVERLRRQITLQEQLCRRLEAIATRLDTDGVVTVEQLIQTLEAISMVESRFSPEELEFIKQRGEIVGPARIKEVEELEWPALFDEVRREIASGTDPSSPRGQDLAARWWSLVAEFTGGHPGIEKKVAETWNDDPTQGGLAPGDMSEMMAWINRAGGRG